ILQQGGISRGSVYKQYSTSGKCNITMHWSSMNSGQEETNNRE
ncbi:hypothetical protein LINPERHAP1_LOCUS11640, partial [Linum perenne]